MAVPPLPAPAIRPRMLAKALAVAISLLALVACGESEVCALSLVAFGDQGTGNCGQLKVAIALERFCAEEGCDAGILLGDNFYPGGVTSVHDLQWEAKFTAMYGRLGFPFYASLGNHDYDGDDFSRGKHQVDYATIDPRWIMPNEYYTVERPPALLMALDTQLIWYGKTVSAQAAMVDEAVQASGARWKIAFGHHPYLANGGPVTRRPEVSAFYEDHLCGKADLFLAGHNHHLEVLDGPESCPGIFVVSGGGAKLRPVDDENGDLARFAASKLGFAHLDITDERIRLRMIHESGRVLYDEVVLD